MSLKKLAKVDSIKKVLKRDKDEASTAPEPSDLHGTIAEDSNNISKMTSVLTTAKVDWSMHDDEVAGAHPHIELGSVQEAELAAELKKRVPPEAVRENEELVDFMVLACLRFRRYDMATAEERVLNYLRWRRDTFGDLAPHTLNTDPRLRERVQQQFLGVLPQRVTSGEAVLLVQLRFLEPHKYTPLESLKAWHWWVMQTLRQDPRVCEKGLVLLVNQDGAQLSKLDGRVPKAILGALSKCVPVRLVRMLIVKPITVIRLLYPIMQYVLSAKLRERLFIVKEFVDLQDTFGLPKDLLPPEVGGCTPFDRGACSAPFADAVV